MSLFSGLSNIFHGIGHVFDNQDDDKKKQQQNAGLRPTVIQPTRNPNETVEQLLSGPPAAQSPALNQVALQKVTPKPAKKPGASILHDLTHNPVTNLVGGIVKPTAEMGHALIKLPNMVAADVQAGVPGIYHPNASQQATAAKNQAGIQKDVYGTTDSGKLLKKIVGDTVNTGLLVAAPGVDSLAETGVKTAAGETAEQLAKAQALHAAGVSAQDAVRLAAQDTGSTALTKIAPKVIAGATVGGAQGATSTAEDGGSFKQVLKSAATNAVVGGATAGFFSSIPVLAKAVAAGHITPQEADGATQVADGVHTVNPDRPTDAAKQLGVPAEAPASGVVDDAAPAPIPEANIAPIDPSTVPEPLPEAQPVSPDEMHPLETQQMADLTKAGKTRKLTDPEKDTIAALQAKQDAIQAANAPADATATATPKKGAKAVQTVDNAPGIREALKKKSDTLAATLGDPSEHDVLSNEDLNNLGKQHADTFDDAGLVNEYKNGYNPHGATELAHGKAAIDRLNEILKNDPKNVDAQKALDNLMQGVEKEISGGARSTNYAQAFYDGLKGPAKTSYLIRQLNKVRAQIGKPEYTEEQQLEATKTVDSHVKAEEDTKGKINTLETRLAELKQEAQAAQDAGKQVSKDNRREAVVLEGAIEDRKLELSKNTSDLGKFYEHEAPQKLAVKAKAGDFGRSLMLSSIAGRGNDIATTGINVGHQLLQHNVEAVGGKLLRKAPGEVIDTLPSIRAVGRGVKYGLKQSRARFKGDVAGNANTSELLKKAGDATGKAQLSNRSTGITSGLRKVVRSATEVATDLSEGIKKSRIQQLSMQEGKKAGLTGENLKSWAAANTASPSRKLTEAGEQLQAEVNNMHDNKITDALGGISEAIAKFPVVGEQLKNMTLPFTRWTGGQMHNALVDKNALVNTGQLIKAMVKGDKQGAITAASKVAVNGVASIGAGYALARSGLLVNKNAEGYDDDGAYLHVDGRYIPVGFLGFFAPGLVMGAAAHDAMQENGGGKGNILTTTLDATGKTLVSAYKSLGGDSLTGVSNPVIQALDNAGKNGYGAVASALGGETVNDYVPAVTGDINSALNNGVGAGGYRIPGSDTLNKTHEASETKVTKGSQGVLTKSGKPSAAKDTLRTTVNEELNKIPVVSQLLFKRKEGVAAPDEIDRITRGDRDTTKGIQDKADAATKVKVQQSLDDRIASNAKAGIPDPDADSSSDSTQHYAKGDNFNNAIENRIENKKYDQALAGLNLKLKDLQDSPDSTAKQMDPVKKQIGEAEVLKLGKYDPSIRDDYKNVSVSQWRDMGDPTSDTYDPAEYQKLFTYDQQLASHSASGNTDDATKAKYSAKDTSKSDAKKSATAAADLIKGNKLSATTPDFKAPDLSGLSLQKIGEAGDVPTIQALQASDLIKKRKISVS